MKKVGKNTIIEIIKKSAIFLLIEIVAILLITTLLFLVGITVTRWHLPIITIIAIAECMLFYKKDNWKINIIAIVLGMLLFVDPADRSFVEKHLKQKNEVFYHVGEVVAGSKKVQFKD